MNMKDLQTLIDLDYAPLGDVVENKSGLILYPQTYVPCAIPPQRSTPCPKAQKEYDDAREDCIKAQKSYQPSGRLNITRQREFELKCVTESLTKSALKVPEKN